MVEDAVRLAARGHYHQFRKRDRAGHARVSPGEPLPEDHIPYVTHLMGTVTILARLGAPDDVLAAAALHDYLEDVPDPEGERRILAITNREVLELVLALTENKRPDLDRSESWQERKSEQLDRIETMPRDAVLIKGADTLHNLLSLEMDLAGSTDPKAVWSRFNAGREQQLWYYTNILDAVTARLEDHPLVAELTGVVERLGD
jgi:(p)ppGpp synthase/HD superfamily hydrolase